jgi:HD-like signal output (HDOD) protein
VVLKGLDVMETRSGRPFTPPIVAELIRLLHAPLGHAVLTKWKVAHPVCDVAKRHHEPDPPDSDVLLVRVQAANRISRKIGAHPEPDPELDLMTLPEIERLAMSELEIAALAVEIEDELAKALQVL